MLSDVLNTLKSFEPVLRARGVIHASVFGSVVRGEETANSDIDILIDLEEGRPVSVFDYAAIKEMIGDIVQDKFHGQVDVVIRDGLKKSVRERVEKEAVDAF